MSSSIGSSRSSVFERSAARALLLLIAAVLGLTATALQADYRELYRKGIQAADFKRWQAVARLMREAIREQPRATGEPILIDGVRDERYRPYYHLGLALHALGDCKGAVEAWDLAEQEGSFRNLRYQDGKNVRRWRDDCRKLLPPEKPPENLELQLALDACGASLAKAQRALADAEKLYSEWMRRLRLFNSSDMAHTFPNFETRLTGARDKLSQAQQDHDQGKTSKDIGMVRVTEKNAQEIAADINGLSDEVRGLLGWLEREAERLRRQRVALLNELDGTLATARKVLDKASQSDDPRLTRATSALRQLLAEVGEIQSTGTLESLEDFRLQVEIETDALELEIVRASPVKPPPQPPADSMISLPPPPPDPPPNKRSRERLRLAAKAYLSLDFQGALSNLRDPDTLGEGFQAAGYLLRAAIYHALYLETGQHDTRLRQAAVADASICRRLAPDLSPPPAFFSSPFIELFWSAR